jgi:hypothetical protein
MTVQPLAQSNGQASGSKPPNAQVQPRRALRAVGWMRLFGRVDARLANQRLSDSWLSPERRPARSPSTLMSSSSEGQ